MKTIAIVILNWNGESLLKQFLPKVIEHSALPNARVIVADNASTDNSITLLESSFPEIEIIKLKKNYGFAGGYNKALKHVEADYFMLLNSDVLPAKNWISELNNAIKRHPEAAVMMPKIRSYKEPNKFEYAGAAGGFIDKYGYTFCRGRLFDTVEIDNSQYETEDDIFWASGAAFLIKSDFYKLENGFDESFFAHMEEIDLCWRLKNRGLSIKYIPTSKVYHVGGASLDQSHPFKTYLNFRNNLYLLIKNLPEKNFSTIILWRLILDGIAVFKFILSFEFKFAFAVFKAHMSFYQNLPDLVQKRNKLLKTRTKQTHNEVYLKSIVFDFFVRKKARFSELDF